MSPQPSVIAVVGAPEVALALRGIGFSVTAATSLEQLREVRRLLVAHEVFRLVVADTGEPQHRAVQDLVVLALTQQEQQQVPVEVVLLVPESGGRLEGYQRATCLVGGVSVNAVLQAMRYQPHSDPVSSLPLEVTRVPIVEESGGLLSLPGGGGLPLPVPPAPVAPPPMPASAPPMPAPAPPMPAPAPPMPASVESPMPASVESPMPAPVESPMPASAPLPMPAPAAVPQMAPRTEPPTPATPTAAPPAPTTPAVPPTPARNGTDHLGAYFNRHEHHTPGAFRTNAHLALVFAGKGGVSKTTTSFSLAAYATGHSNLRCLVIDGNRGQGGIRSLLRIPETSPLPSIHDLASPTAQPADVVCTPDMLERHRPRLEPVKFAAVLAPPPALATPEQTPAHLYRDLIRAVRHDYDLIIVDTQVFDAEIGDLFADVWIPELRQGAWGVALTDSSTESTENLLIVLDLLHERGVSSARMLAIAALWEPGEFDEDNEHHLRVGLASLAHLVGATVRDSDLATNLTLGNVDVEHDAIRPVLAQVLHTITGDTAFEAAEHSGTSRRKFWPWKRGR